MSDMIKNVQRFFLISLPAVLITLVILEVFLRLFVPVSDMHPKPIYDAESDMLLFEPNVAGTLRVPAYEATYRVNSQGWNSHREYQYEKPSENITRIAVIGDSYVEALQVDYDKSVSALLDYRLAETYPNAYEVYSFGKSNAPLSEYLQIMRYVARTYSPDIYIIIIIRNDFEQSLREYSEVPFFLQFTIDDNGTVTEIPPIPWERGPAQSLYRTIAPHSALVRFLAYNLGLLERFTLQYGPNYPSVLVTEENVEETRPDVETLVSYVLPQYLETATSTDSRLLLVVDAPRHYIYEGKPPTEAPEYMYFSVVDSVADDLGIPTIDLTETFEADYARNHVSFNFEKDRHWNEYGHQVVADRIWEELNRLGWLVPADSNTESQ